MIKRNSIGSLGQLLNHDLIQIFYFQESFICLFLIVFDKAQTKFIILLLLETVGN